MTRLLWHFALLACSFALFAGPALAEAPPKNTALPGVDGDHRIVRPNPPRPADAKADPDGRFRIGDMEVRIGGEITVEVGAGTRSSRRR